jgi:hypothetical protein
MTPPGRSPQDPELPKRGPAAFHKANAKDSRLRDENLRSEDTFAVGGSGVTPS